MHLLSQDACLCNSVAAWSCCQINLIHGTGQALQDGDGYTQVAIGICMVDVHGMFCIAWKLSI